MKTIIINVNENDFKLRWLKFILDIKFNVALTKREYAVLLEMSKFPKIGTKERKAISGALNCSEQVVTNNLKLLKDKNIIKQSKNNKSYIYELNIPVFNNLETMLNTQIQLEFKHK